MVMPYLHFNGNCEEAFNFYAEAFGGKLESIIPYDDSPNSKVMHGEVRLTETGGVSGSDSVPPELLPEKYEILVHLPSREKLEIVFAKLSEGATHISDFKPHTPGDSGGGAYVTDRYGYSWILCSSVE